jgi:hypothetical protein
MKGTLVKYYRVKADYCYGDDREAKRQQQKETLQKVGLSEHEEGFVICTAEQVIQLLMHGYCDTYGNFSEKVQEVLDTGTEDIEKIIQASVRSSTDAVKSIFNERTNTEQPSVSLMNVDETLLMEDACTDALQRNLSDGWRILAICPQPQRRPDYVLGRQCLPKLAHRG